MGFRRGGGDARGCLYSLPCELGDPLDSAAHSFSLLAREQHQKLLVMHDSMGTLYQDMLQYFAIDPKKTSVEEFFTDMSNFRSMFMVSPLSPRRVCTDRPQCSTAAFAIQRSRPRVPDHLSVMAIIYLVLIHHEILSNAEASGGHLAVTFSVRAQHIPVPCL